MISCIIMVWLKTMMIWEKKVMKEKTKCYKEFGKLYDKNWKESYSDKQNLNQNRKTFLVIFLSIYTALLLVLVVSLFIKEFIVANISAGALILGFIVTIILDKILFVADNRNIIQLKMKCVKKTIPEFLNCDEVDINKALIFTEAFDNVAKGTFGYCIRKNLSLIVCLAGYVVAFAFEKIVDMSDLAYTVIGLFLVFTVQIFFNSDFFKSFLFKPDVYYQGIVMEYRNKLLEDSIGLK